MQRDALLHLIDINMNTQTPDYHLIGEGVNSLSEEFNAEEETNKWINQKEGVTDVKSYTPSITVEMQDVDQEDTELVEWVNKMIDTLPTGKDAVSSYIRVRATGEGSSYPAVRRKCTITVVSTGGEAGGNVTNSIKIGGRGKGEEGTFDPTTKTFTPKK